MRRLFVAAFAAAATLASASPPWSTGDDDTPKVTDPSVPLSYVGGDGSISLGFNADGETEGQLMGVFARNDERAVVGQLWWDRSGAGGLQGDFNWLWGATAAEAREDPSKAAVARLSFAVAQNGEHNRKATLGFGFERRDYSIDAYLSRGIGGGKHAGSVFADETRPVTGSDDIGTYTELETTTIETLLESKAYDSEFGVQFSHVFDPIGMRVYGGAGLQDGEGSASAKIFSLGVDSPLGRRGWAMSARAEHQRRDGDFEDDRSDTRLSLYLRYQFGGRGAFVPTSELTSPAWVQRALGRASSAAPRTVDSYRTARGRNVTVTHGPREYDNHFPLARADSAATTEGMPVMIDVLANDTDPDGDALAISSVAPPANGTATIEGSAILYTPAPGFTGTDSFTYSVVDPAGGVAGATVTVTITESVDPNQPPVARNDRATTTIDSPVSIAVLANDFDPDDDVLTIVSVGTPANGTAARSGNSVLYTPAPGFVGSDSFPYTIEDGNGGSATAMVTVLVTQAPNRPPFAIADAAATTIDTPVSIAVLANDSDPDGDPLSILSVGTPASGTASITGNTILYAPAPGTTGNDSFPYTISDGRGGTATALVSVRVNGATPNNPPVAQDDAATAPGGGTVTIPVLANDSDPDGDPLAILAVGTPALGTAAISGAGIVYTAPVGIAATDTFTYTIGDGRGGQATGTVTVTIAAPNTPPVAIDDDVVIDPAIPATIDVLDNDTDADGDPLAIVAVTTPASGTAVIAGNAIVYTADATFTGTDAFQYTVSDGRGGTATATVRITGPTPPNNPPIANADLAATTVATPVTIPVLVNDTDPDGDPLSIVSTTTPPGGTVTIAGDAVIYQPVSTFLGTDTFTYTISDGRGGTATATVTVTVTQPNQPPVATNDGYAVQYETATTLPVLDNDSDPDGDPLTIIATSQPANGTVSFNGTTVTYVPAAGYTGMDTFTYTISDGRGGVATAAVVILVNA